MINIMPEQEVAAPMLLLPAPEKPKVHRVRRRITVPAGHVLPLGNVVKTAFDITVEAGARWHPEWGEPLITVNAYRFLGKGDAVGWSGDETAAFPLDADLSHLAAWHGKSAMYCLSTLRKLGLDIPEGPETIYAMVPQQAPRLQ